MALLLHFSFAVIYPASSSVFLSKSHFYPASSSVFLSKSHLQLCTGKICIVFRSQKSYFIHIVLILVSLIKLCVTQKDVHNLTSGRTFLFVCFLFFVSNVPTVQHTLPIEWLISDICMNHNRKFLGALLLTPCVVTTSFEIPKVKHTCMLGNFI